MLSTASWPITAPSTKLILPPELLKTKDRFEQYYTNKHSGRKLTWIWQHSRNECVPLSLFVVVVVVERARADSERLSLLIAGSACSTRRRSTSS